jgi:predicted nucleotidyltransferase
MQFPIPLTNLLQANAEAIAPIIQKVLIITLQNLKKQLIIILITYAMNRSQLQIILQKVKQSLSKFYQDKLEKIILYGSQARGDATEYSDIDILVVLKSAINPYDEIDKTSEIIADLCLEYDVVISRHFISSEKFNNQNTPFIYNVKKEGIMI